MPGIVFDRFASLLRRWIADLGTLASHPRRFNVRDQSPDFWGREEALRPAYARIRRELDRS